MNPQFSKASFLEFRRAYKREFYAWMYGSAEAERLSNDTYRTYCMGGEL